MENIQVSNILKRSNRSLDDSFYIEFARLYNSLRETLLPEKTKEIVMKLIDCKHTQYYTYLRISRKKDLIMDSYIDNNRAQRQREIERLLLILEESGKLPSGTSVDIDEIREKGLFYILREFFGK